VAVQTTKAKLETISDMVAAGGTLYPLRQAALSPKISAPVRTFYVNRGDHVRRGQLLAVLENRDLAATVTASEGAFDQAQANYTKVTATALPEQLQTAELDLQNAESNLKAQQKLYDSNLWLYEQHAGARKQVDQAEVALTAAKSQYLTAKTRLQNLRTMGKTEQVNAAEGQLESARGQYLSAKAQLGYSELRSPINGVVADRSVYPGEMAAAATPLITVMDVSKVVVRLHVPQSKTALLKLGDPAALHVPGLKSGVPGKVTVFSPALDPGSTTVEIWVEAANPHHNLQPGTPVEVSMVAKVVPNALVVPASSILTASDGAKSVMVVHPDSRAFRQSVTTGIENNGEMQILSGLKPGDEIIATGAYGLPDKTKVNATPVSPRTPS
jgi:multidrug efflux pump subunit AcrA (membrane-fusion protein)